ncbi:probable galactinol--sucrose galactosyltransferase 2 [Phragmites australis]|uniref:probable galactinol--sucrose galactosyltransferase 2 n=1 Tax=Phragmites australis TaxID=29695 RepID=UPI002D778E0C|nr:probable galactinol--sucrose galactosyltransferase 2 [Phragmites australis]
MTVTPKVTVGEGRLVAHGRTILTGVPDSIVLTHASGAGLVDGAFVGATADEAKSLHVFTFGTLRDLRFMCCFRFKLWWMTQRMGTSGREVPLETQFMLLESRPGNNDADDDSGEPVYLVMLPLLEGQFRAALQGNGRDELEITLESGDKAVQTAQGTYMVYVHAGTNPFDTITQAVKVVERHMQTFHHREKKKLPSFVDWFGWCTWDAFYTDVTADGVKQGLQSLAEGGTPPRFLIVDDGWQQIGSENKEESNAVVQEGAQFASRLTGIKENAKFQKKNQKDDNNNNGEQNQNQDQAPGLKMLVEEVKREHKVKYVYVWHAMAGYWGGVKPAAAGMEHYESALAYPVQSPGVMGNQPDIVMDSLSVLGLGLVHPRKVYSFYNELHSYLASCGVDGVKVDVQNIIETLGAGHGGRVSLTRAYHHALEASVARNFPDNGCISCMCHNTDMFYSARQTAVVRASDDFYPRDPASHTIHISSVAYNTLFLGEFMQPDWDMFHSLHPAAEYHGAARAIGGCPIYVSDKPGNHNFDLLKKLVLPDGSVLRAQLPGRPTRDCLFADPARDGTSLLKIWNVNKCTGVVGVFNCQGAGWCRVTKKTRVHDAAPGTLTGSVRAEDVDAIAHLAGPDWNGGAVVYTHRSGELIMLPKGATLPVTLKVLEFELFHVSPVKVVAPGVSFAPIGLLNMFNSGGAVEQCEIRAPEGTDGTAAVVLRVHGCGRFGAYCSQRPARCTLDAAEVEFSYDADTGLVALYIPVPEQELYRWTLEILV